MDYQQIIERLKLIRMRNHISAKDLGKLLGNSYTYFYKVEDGSIILSMPKLLEVLQLLGVTTEEFFYDDFENYKIDKEILEISKSLTKPEIDTMYHLLRKRNTNKK